MRQPGTFWLASMLVVLAVSRLNAFEQNRYQADLQRPVAIAVDQSGKWIYVANSGSGNITAINLQDHSSRPSTPFAQSIQDLVAVPGSDKILAITRSPNRCLMLKCKDGDLATQVELDLSIDPECCTISRDQQFVGITDRWNKKICILEYVSGDSPKLALKSTLDLPVMPKEILAMENSNFCVADAFEGKLTIVDAMACEVISNKRFQGHHIGGLIFDERVKTIWITHQILSKVAHSTRDDIHWGSLIQNVVRGISTEALATNKEDAGKNSILYSLGDVGNGEADPSGIALWKEHLVIAASGANHLLRFNRASSLTKSFDTLVQPSRIAFVGEDRVAVVCKLSHAIVVVDLNEFPLEDFELRVVYVNPNPDDSPSLAGEIAFHSASLSHDRWMSCNSCHVDGHTPNLIADTFGDESFGAPKRIPSLLGNSETAPFGWYGNKATLEKQILQTLASTMQAPQAQQEREKLADELAAYLKTLASPKRMVDSGNVQSGQALFESRGCSKCHQVENHFTSNSVYDVGVRDELGHREFNPPTLIGVGLRSRYLHDGRYHSLKELLNHHPTNQEPWDEQEADEIIRYLKQL